MDDYKHIIRPVFGGKYNHELLNSLFYHPYTKIGHIEANMQVSRQTASRYLEKIVELGLLQKEKMWKENYYINTRLMKLFIGFGKYESSDNNNIDNDNSIESVHVKEEMKI